jgi:hypothetical protein
MRRGRDTRLARLASERMRFDSTTGLDDCTTAAWNMVCAIVRDGLVQAGIDPTCAAALRPRGTDAEVAEPGGKLASRRVEDELAAADDGLAGMFTVKIGEIARRFRDGREPDFASASLAELWAWLLSRRGSCSL